MKTLKLKYHFPHIILKVLILWVIIVHVNSPHKLKDSKLYFLLVKLFQLGPLFFFLSVHSPAILTNLLKFYCYLFLNCFIISVYLATIKCFRLTLSIFLIVLDSSSLRIILLDMALETITWVVGLFTTARNILSFSPSLWQSKEITA